MKPFKRLGTAIFLLAILPSATTKAAFVDEIVARPQEVYQAAKEALAGGYGLNHEDPECGILESEWGYACMVRKDKILGGVFQKAYLRRSRIRIEVSGEASLTRLTVSARHQYKRTRAGARASWKTLAPQLEDSLLERQFFREVIRHLEHLRLTGTR